MCDFGYTCNGSQQCAYVNFIPDPNLKNCVESALGKLNPTTQDMATLTNIPCGNNGVASLTGLEYATNLTSLFLENNNLNSVASLANLTRLETLNISNNNIQSISSLSNLTRLWHLDIENNRITSLSGTENMNSLVALHAQNNNITTLIPLMSSPSLERLYISNNPINSLAPIRLNNNLRRIEANNTSLEIISGGLKDMPSLMIVYIENNSRLDVNTDCFTIRELESALLAKGGTISYAPLNCAAASCAVGYNFNPATGLCDGFTTISGRGCAACPYGLSSIFRAGRTYTTCLVPGQCSAPGLINGVPADPTPRICQGLTGVAYRWGDILCPRSYVP